VGPASVVRKSLLQGRRPNAEDVACQHEYFPGDVSGTPEGAALRLLSLFAPDESYCMGTSDTLLSCLTTRHIQHDCTIALPHRQGSMARILESSGSISEIS
jgi:hypothetical protein